MNRSWDLGSGSPACDFSNPRNGSASFPHGFRGVADKTVFYWHARQESNL
jgi:hypothetical protein